jgi:ComEC/Rec2-related protein
MKSVGRLPCAGLALSGAAGIAMADLLPPVFLPFAMAATGLACLALRLQRSWLVHATLAFAFAALHSANWHFSAGKMFADRIAGMNHLITLEGQVTSEARVTAGGERVMFDLRATRSTTAGLINGTPRIRVIAEGVPPPPVGSIVSVCGQVVPIAGPRNPGEFDYASHMARRGVFSQILVKSPRYFIVESIPNLSWPQFVNSCRSHGERLLAVDLEDSPDVAATIKAITLGVTDDVEPELFDDFRKSGALHLFSVSGLHVAMFAWMMHVLVTTLRFPRFLGLALNVATITFYVILTGASSAAVRAGVMSIVVLLGAAGSRQSSPANSLFAAALILLVADTNQLFHAGFQLSFAAVLGILIVYRPLQHWFRSFVTHDPFIPASLVSPLERKSRKALRYVTDLCALSAAASLGTAPLSCFHFHLLTPMSIVANIVVVPLAFGILALGIATLLTGSVFGLLAQLWNNANWLLTHVVISAVHFFASLPGASVNVGRYPFARDDRVAEVLVLDTNRGFVAFARSSKSNILFNTGSERDYERTTRSVLAAYGVNTLSHAIFTQGDSNHFGGGNQLLSDFPVSAVVVSSIPDRSRVREALEISAGARLQRVTAGEQIELAPNIAAEILYPISTRGRRTAADRAMVIRLKIGEWKFLLTSGASFNTESDLLDAAPAITSQFVLQGDADDGALHHPNFVTAVRPMAVVSNHPQSGARRPAIEFDQGNTGAVRFVVFPDRVVAEPFLGSGTWEWRIAPSEIAP